MTEPVEKQVAPYGGWRTPVTSELLVAGAVKLGDLAVDGDDVLWAEERPTEGGRTELVRRRADGTTEDLLGPGHDARTAVHEYGGGAWWVRDGVVWFADAAGQRLHRRSPDGTVEPLTPEPEVERGDRYADGDVSPDGRRIVCIREHHPPGGRGAVDVRNELVTLAAHEPSQPEVVVTGPDFVLSPRWSPDGHLLCWVEWDHPAMPWDGTRLVVHDLRTGDRVLVAGGPEESVTSPAWRADGSLLFVSDRSGWWNLDRWDPADGRVGPVVEIEAEIGLPPWQPGFPRYAELADGRVVFAATADGFDALHVRLPDGAVHRLDLPLSTVATLRRRADASLVMASATATTEPAVVRVDLGDGSEVASTEVLRTPRDLGIDPATWSAPEPIEYPSPAGGTAYGLFYPPRNPAFEGPGDERPPLVVMIHGGPTAAARPLLQLPVQYWTTRGFAVVDVNYSGSTGFGRAFRERLRGAWGVVDVDDCLAAARWLAEQGRVDGARLCIRGGSAGGFTTLAALTRPDTPFAAGCSAFGVADLAALAAGTHKLESRYLDSLVAPYPERRDVYDERSPINHVDRLDRPLLVLQGADDPVVLPEQSRMIVEALRARHTPVAYLEFEGEQHGFRVAANIRKALDSELSFYAQVLGFALPAEEGIEPVAVEFLSPADG
jgi:dipeptidyl aminopeptidase/acylaminoacyl peptidase